MLASLKHCMPIGMPIEKHLFPECFPENRCKNTSRGTGISLSYKHWHLSLREVAVRSSSLSLAQLLQGICFSDPCIDRGDTIAQDFGLIKSLATHPGVLTSRFFEFTELLSESINYTALLHNLICSKTRFDFSVYSYVTIRYRTIPNIMVTFTVTFKIASVFL